MGLIKIGQFFEKWMTFEHGPRPQKSIFEQNYTNFETPYSLSDFYPILFAVLYMFLIFLTIYRYQVSNNYQ